MPVLFFSGGIDSTALAWDVGVNPFRYGVEDDETLYLVTCGGREKKRQLARLVTELRKKSRLDVDHRVVDDGLYFEKPEPPTKGGFQTLNPISSRYPRDLASTPYTPGWMLWMAAYAVNLLYSVGDCHSDRDNPPQVLIAHQWNGPVWRELEEGKKMAYDCLPEFFVHLNAAIQASGERVRVRCPFLESRTNRVQIVELARSLEVPLNLTSSCVHGWMKNCGVCASCILRNNAFITLGIE